MNSAGSFGCIHADAERFARRIKNFSLFSTICKRVADLIVAYVVFHLGWEGDWVCADLQDVLLAVGRRGRVLHG